jgi:hypothetical protein
MKLCQAYPSITDVRMLPEFKAALESDISCRRFDLEFEEQEIVLMQSITNWRNTLESYLIELLPEDTHEPDFNVPGYSLMIGTDNCRPISDLAVSVQKLLRADTVFREPNTSFLCFYPDDFVRKNSNYYILSYCTESARVAKRLLTEFGRPDASALEMKMMGRVFQCMRCHTPPKVMTWKDIVSTLYSY